MGWKSIRLELAGTPDFPTGSVSRAYLLRLPLDDQDSVDERALHENPGRAVARRHWSTEPDERGLIVRADGRWAIRSEGKDRTLTVNHCPIRLGAQVVIVDERGEALPFRVASVR